MLRWVPGVGVVGAGKRWGWAAGLLLLLLASIIGLEAADFDYSPPIRETSRQAWLNFGGGEREFYYQILSAAGDPFEQPYYRVSLALAVEAESRVLRATPKRIPFSDGEVISSSNEAHENGGGSYALRMGGYDALLTSDGWYFHDTQGSDSSIWWKRLTNVIIGLRYQRYDGTHFAWIRFSRADTNFTTVFQPQEFDWNPIPEAPIRAGQSPVIPITPEVTAQGLRLSWSRSLAGWVLESTGSLSDDAVWVTVPRAPGYVVLVEPSDANRYFRLRRP